MSLCHFLGVFIFWKCQIFIYEICGIVTLLDIFQLVVPANVLTCFLGIEGHDALTTKE